MNIHQPHDGAADRTMSSKSKTGLFRVIDDLWRSKNHRLIIAGAVCWIICPLDGDFVPILGWADDCFAFVLAVKHFMGLFTRDVDGLATLSATTNGLQRPRAVDCDSVSENLGDAEITVLSPTKPRK